MNIHIIVMAMESPSFKDVLEKICKECGSPDPPIFDDISKVISCSIHGVEITIDYSDPKAVKTKSYANQQNMIGYLLTLKSLISTSLIFNSF